jgi:hypothetical protein
VSQISEQEASDLLSKLLQERRPLRILFVTGSGVRCNLPGFIESMSEKKGLVVSESGAPVNNRSAWLNIRAFNRRCEFHYGEMREIPADFQALMEPEEAESMLMIRFLDAGETAMFFFSL